MHINPKIIAVILVSFVSLFSWQAMAYRLSPMSQTFSPKGTQSTQSFVIENTSDVKKPIKIEVTTRRHDQDGKETREPSSDFVVFPEQVVIEPKSKRNIRVTWVGEKEPTRELCYRLIVTELPIDLKPKKELSTKADLNFVMQYVASLYVAPEGASPKIEVTSVQKLPGDEVEIMVANQGTAHKSLFKASLSFSPKKKEAGEKIELTGKDLEKLRGENLLPGETRKFRFKEVKLPVKVKDWIAEVQID